MKKQLSVNFNYLCLIVLVFCLSISACKKDDENAAIDREAFLGSFTVAETCDGFVDSYEFTITPSSAQDSEIFITNLYDWEEQMTATISGTSLTLPKQEADDLTFEGSGNLVEDILTINYTVKEEGETERCMAIGTRQ